MRAELAARTGLALAILGAARWSAPPARAAAHLWLPMRELEAERVAGRALRAGVQVTPPRAPFLTGAPVSGLRICLGAAADLTALERGLAGLCARSAGGPESRAQGMV